MKQFVWTGLPLTEDKPANLSGNAIYVMVMAETFEQARAALRDTLGFMPYTIDMDDPALLQAMVTPAFAKDFEDMMPTGKAALAAAMMREGE